MINKSFSIFVFAQMMMLTDQNQSFLQASHENASRNTNTHNNKFLDTQILKGGGGKTGGGKTGGGKTGGGKTGGGKTGGGKTGGGKSEHKFHGSISDECRNISSHNNSNPFDSSNNTNASPNNSNSNGCCVVLGLIFIAMILCSGAYNNIENHYQRV
jgi:hypothetical protein